MKWSINIFVLPENPFFFLTPRSDNDNIDRVEKNFSNFTTESDSNENLPSFNAMLNFQRDNSSLNLNFHLKICFIKYGIKVIKFSFLQKDLLFVRLYPSWSYANSKRFD